MNIINQKYKDLSIYFNDFKSANHFPHLVLDDFLNKDFFENLKIQQDGLDSI